MNSSLRQLAAGVLHASGYYSLRRRIDSRRGRRLLVLMYHDIVDDSRSDGHVLDADSPTVSEFAAHIDTAVRRFRLVSLGDAAREIRNGGLEHDSVAITFDDGYSSVHRHALPVLQRHSVPATLFVLTGWIDGMTFWWNRLRDTIASARLDGVSVDTLAGVMDVSPSLLNGSPVGSRPFRVNLARVAEDRLRGLDDDTRNEQIRRIDQLLVSDADATPAAPRALTWTEVEDLARHGVELAAHTLTHVNFRYAPAERVHEEIVRSRDLVAVRTDRPVVGFAYPYGKDLDHYHRYESFLRESGFEYACTASPGNNRAGSNLFSLRRVTAPATRSTALIDHALCHAFVRDDSFYDIGAVR